LDRHQHIDCTISTLPLHYTSNTTSPSPCGSLSPSLCSLSLWHSIWEASRLPTIAVLALTANKSAVALGVL
ncbi:hypothetical protein CERZMDRAFT_122780, partial [Cercospora zeae-maydis SCOH1-5]